MDFSKFLDDDFNVTTWVNEAFKSHQGGSVPQNKRDVYAATLVTKLQVFIQEVNKSLEEMSQQVVLSMPRVLRDVEALKQETAYLRQQMQQVREEIHDVEQNTSHTMKVLVLTDQVRNRVEQTCASLREADNWSSLASAIEETFRNGDSHAIAVRLKSMQNSLEILKDSPDYDDKVMHLEALKNRLESHVSPHVVAAFMHHNTDDARKLQVVFSTIDRENELHKYYIKCYNSSLITQWQEIIANEEDKSNISVMEALFQLLLTTWHSQLPWCCTVFGNAKAPEILIQLLNITAATKPGIADVISGALETTNDPKMIPLLALHKIAKEFTANLQQAIYQAVDSKLQIHEKLTVNLNDTIWMPFAPFQLNFKELEKEILLTKLSEVVMDAGDLMDLTQVLSASVDKIFAFVSESITHCENLTNFLGSEDLIIPLDVFFRNYTDRFSRALRTVNVQYGLSAKDSSTIEISEEHYYSLFRHALRIISTCGKILQQFSDFEQCLISNIMESGSADEALEGLLEFNNPKCKNEKGQVDEWMKFNYLKKLDEKGYRKLQDMLLNLKHTAPSQRCLLPAVMHSLTNLNQQAHQLAFDIAFAQIKRQLALIPQQEIWGHAGVDSSTENLVDDSELPSFSLSPTECATTIGQYLMTLPQNLEPLAAGLSEKHSDFSAMETAMHTATLPFSMEDVMEKSEMDHMADRWLTSIVRASEHTYVEACLQIRILTTHAARQLAVDLDYMSNVVDSLGLPVLKDITLLTKLLRASECDYHSASQGLPKRLVSSVAQIRNIKAS